MVNPIAWFVSLFRPRPEPAPAAPVIGYATLLTDGPSLAAPIIKHGRMWEANFRLNRLTRLQGIQITLLLRCPDMQIGPMATRQRFDPTKEYQAGERITLRWEEERLATFEDANSPRISRV